MSISNDIQGLSLALFGAFVGGGLKRLTDQANSNGRSAVASDLVNMQAQVLQKDLSRDDVWADQVLANLGLTSPHPAYVPAKVWFLVQSGLNRPRADIVSEAVGFLLQTAQASQPDPNYLALAQAFRTDVIHGVSWSGLQPITTGALFADIDQLQSQVLITRTEKAQALKSDVQGLALALFGGFAGGHFANLLSQAQANGVAQLARELTTLQPSLLKRDLSSAKAWSDLVLGNLGIGTDHAAYPSASAWFMDQAALARDRGAIAQEAIAYLQKLPSTQNPDANFAKVANNFNVKVIEGIRWSEDKSQQGGAAVLDLAALQGQNKAPAKPVQPVQSDSVLKDVLKAFFAALQTQKNILEGGDPGSAAAIEAAELKAESAIRDALNNGSFVYNQDESVTGQTKAANDLENAAQAEAIALLNQVLLNAQNTAMNAKSKLDLVNPQAAALVESLAKLNANLSEATETVYQAETDLFTRIEKGISDFPVGTVAFYYDVETRVFELLSMRNDGDVVIASYAGGNWSQGPAYRASADTLKPLSEAYVAAYASYLGQEAAVVQFLRPLERLNANFTTADTVNDVDAYTMTTEEADFYLGAFTALESTAASVAKAKAALDQVLPLRTGNINPVTLQKNVDDARNAIDPKTYNVIELNTSATLSASSKGDLYFIGKLQGTTSAVKITDFGLQNDDALVVFGYRLAASDRGDNKLLEFTVQQQGKDTLLRFENDPGALGVSASVSNGFFSVTLIGVDTSQISYADHLILG